MRLELVMVAAFAIAQHQVHHPTGAHGAAVMGFSQTETSHHFRLSPGGGAVEVHVHDAANTALRDKVADHLRMIAKAFSQGDFATPLAVHGEPPAGAGVMRAKKNAITYTFEESDRGGRVIVQTADADALRAVHEFLRYQIREHKTGDSLNVLR